MTDWKTLEEKLLADPAVKKEYERLAPQYAVISQLISARIKNGMTQKEIAEKSGTKQSAIARFESGMSNPTLGFLQKIADAMGYKLTIHLSS